jgi:transcriptional antiterminator NusG
MNWYALHTYSGMEKKVKKDVEHRASVEGMRSSLGEVIVPEERIVEQREGKKREHVRNIMPGYVFVEMEDETLLFDLIKEIKGVTGFVGGNENQPSPLSQEEVDNIRGLVDDKKDKPRAEIRHRVGDSVKVIEGPFTGFVGAVDNIDYERAKMTVMVSIFGRPTPVELEALQVEAAS